MVQSCDSRNYNSIKCESQYAVLYRHNVAIASLECYTVFPKQLAHFADSALKPFFFVMTYVWVETIPDES